MRTLFCTVVALGLLTIGLALGRGPQAAADAPAGTKVYELRTYKTHPGKLDALLARFREHTCKLFKKHGIEVLGYWTPATGEDAKDTLVYLVVFPSVEAQTKAWQAFKTDPVWIKAKADSEKDGLINKQVISQNLVPTDFSPLR
jgi:hypothetical protein